MSGHLFRLPARDVEPLDGVNPPAEHHGGDLLRRCREGDSSAWEEIVERYERLVFGMAMREGLNRDDAADVTQIVFEALLTSLDKIREGEHVSAWLVVVTRRQAWRVRTRHLRERPVSEVDPGAELAVSGLANAAGAEPDRVLDLYEALSSLGEPCRELLTALYFDPSEPSYEEVAVRLGRPVGSIGPSRARCLEHLRKILANRTPS
ncbi:MAG: sigma-70 family RNA polymerase sigma factor [Kineosporiaceae bacterium]